MYRTNPAESNLSSLSRAKDSGPQSWPDFIILDQSTPGAPRIPLLGSRLENALHSITSHIPLASSMPCIPPSCLSHFHQTPSNRQGKNWRTEWLMICTKRVKTERLRNRIECSVFCILIIFAALGLHRTVFFSNCGKRELLSSCVHASHCGGFSCGRAPASVVLVPRL